MLYENTGSYTPDFASEIDTEEEIAADDYGVTIQTARRILKDRHEAVRRHQAGTLSAIMGVLLCGGNIEAKVKSLGIAMGLNELNSFHSQSEIARDLGCTRALISHYVLGWRDILAGGIFTFDCVKFRKNNKTRAIYAKKATNQIYERIRENIKNRESGAVTSK